MRRRRRFTPLADGVRIDLVRDDTLAQTPAQLHGLVKLSDTVVQEVSVPVVPGEVAPAGSGAATSTAAIGAIGLAFVGGILLNLMPCVFPVLFLKGLALVQSSSQSRAHLRRHGLFYTLGICSRSGRSWRCCWCCAPREATRAGDSSCSRRFSSRCWRR